MLEGLGRRSILSALEVTMIYAGIGNYGVAISESQRSDLVVDYSRLLAEIMKYSEDGANIMIAHEWLEQPPISADRRGLAKG